MSKYIIIPVEDIKKELKTALELKELMSYNGNQWIKNEGRLQLLNSLILKKQISLDDESIEQKAEKAYPQTIFNAGDYRARKGYKQALLDFKKELL